MFPLVIFWVISKVILLYSLILLIRISGFWTGYTWRLGHISAFTVLVYWMFFTSETPYKRFLPWSYRTMRHFENYLKCHEYTVNSEYVCLKRLSASVPEFSGRPLQAVYTHSACASTWKSCSCIFNNAKNCCSRAGLCLYPPPSP